MVVSKAWAKLKSAGKTPVDDGARQGEKIAKIKIQTD